MNRLVAIIVWFWVAVCSGADWQSQTPNVVQILAGNNGGSGAVVCADPQTLDCWAVTCKHVVQGYQTARVTWPNGYSAVGNVVGTGRLNDTALIQVRAPDASFVPVADKPAPAGVEVVALGYGGQSGVRVRDLRLISWRSKLRGYKPSMNDYVQLDPYAQSGDSGGPILDTQGRLVGIVTGGELAGPSGQMLDSHGPYQAVIINLMREVIPQAVMQQCYPCPPNAQIIESPVQQGPRVVVQVPPRTPVQKPDLPIPSEQSPSAGPSPSQDGVPPAAGSATPSCSEALQQLVESQKALNESIQALVNKPCPPGPAGPPGPPGDQGKQGNAPDMAQIIAALKADPEIAAMLQAAGQPIDYEAVAMQIAPLLPPISFKQLRQDDKGEIVQDGIRFREVGVEKVKLGGELVFRGFPRSK